MRNYLFSRFRSRWLSPIRSHGGPKWRKHVLSAFWNSRAIAKRGRFWRHKRLRILAQDVKCPWSGVSYSKRPHFKYDRLNWATKEIRLIRVLPADPAEGEDAPISCSIVNASLDHHPRYIALSYAWGDPTPTRSILLNGSHFQMTASLDDCLHQIRNMQVTSGLFKSEYFWIDAISINQHDQIEKSHQVQQMNHIFAAAEYTLVWLGPDSDNCGKALQNLEHIGLTVTAGHDPFDNLALNTFNFLSSFPDDFSLSLKTLLTRPYWKRVWIVQEFASAREVIILCGDVRVSWRACFGALDAIEKFKRAVAEKGWRGNLLAGDHELFMSDIFSITGILRLFKIRNRILQTQKGLLLWELLTLKRFQMLSTDDRDYIYGLTGIAEDASAKHIYPDYTKHATEVYTNVATSFLIEGRLRTLWLCSHPRRLSNLPSWVPDWSTRWHENRRYFSADSGYGLGESIFASNNIFAAAGNSSPNISFSTRNSKIVLHLQGYRFDHVESTKKAFELQHVMKEDKGFDAYEALVDRFRAFWELQPNIDTVSRSVIADIEPIWSSDLRLNYKRAARTLPQDLRDMILSLKGGPRYKEHSWNLPASRLDVLYRHDGRRPFITSKGHLGLGPSDMARGDVVAIVFGSELPLILREIGEGSYVLIGEAYVDRIMDGEVLQMGLPKNTFDLI